MYEYNSNGESQSDVTEHCARQIGNHFNVTRDSSANGNANCCARNNLVTIPVSYFDITARGYARLISDFAFLLMNLVVEYVGSKKYNK